MSRNTKPLTASERAAQAPPTDDIADAIADDADDAGRPMRSEHRGQMLELKALANRLAALPQGQRRTLPLDEELQATLDLLAAADGRSDRRRLVMRAKLLLGSVDQGQLEAALSGHTPAATRDRACVSWRARLVAGNDEILQQFVEAHPNADRQAIRTSAREARGQGPAAARAHTRLLQLLRDAMAA